MFFTHRRGGGYPIAVKLRKTLLNHCASLPLLKGDLRGMFSFVRLLFVVGCIIIPKRTSPLPPSKGGSCAMF